MFALLHHGSMEVGEQLASKLLSFGDPLGSMLGPQPYAVFQTAFDPLLTPGARNYWKTHNFVEVSDGLIDAVTQAAATLPGPDCEIFLAQLGGALGDVGAAETAFAGRDANFVMNVHGRWQEPDDDDTVQDWARQIFHNTAPFATGGGYVNFLTEDESGRVNSAYAQNYLRLQQLKQQYDPDNLFRMNQNIAPAMLARTA